MLEVIIDFWKIVTYQRLSGFIQHSSYACFLFYGDIRHTVRDNLCRCFFGSWNEPMSDRVIRHTCVQGNSFILWNVLYCLKCTYWSSWKITLGKCYRCIHLLMMTVFRPWWTALSRDEEECLASYTIAKSIVKHNYTAVNNELIFLMMINSFSQFSDCEISYVFSCFVFGKYSVQSQTISLKTSQFWIKMCDLIHGFDTCFIR